MKQQQTNLGKKEQRQIDQLLTKEARGESIGGKEALARTSPKQHKLKPGKRQGGRGPK
jgi:hypothetical protein